MITHAPDVVPVELREEDTTFTHFICCQVTHNPPIRPTTTLCGLASTTAYEGESWRVGCVVCNHLAWAGCCPLQPDERCVDYDPDADDDDDEDPE